MMKEMLPYVGGMIVGAAICYGGYRLYKYYKKENIKQENDIFEEKLKLKEIKSEKLNDLIRNQTYVNLLTSKELTSWFKQNQNKVEEKAKMLIVIPTQDNMSGLGYPKESDIDTEANIIQLFYDEDKGKVLLIRLISYTDIDSNLQAKLIEQDGMIVVTA